MSDLLEWLTNRKPALLPCMKLFWTQEVSLTYSLQRVKVWRTLSASSPEGVQRTNRGATEFERDNANENFPERQPSRCWSIYQQAHSRHVMTATCLKHRLPASSTASPSGNVVVRTEHGSTEEEPDSLAMPHAIGTCRIGPCRNAASRSHDNNSVILPFRSNE